MEGNYNKANIHLNIPAFLCQWLLNMFKHFICIEQDIIITSDI